MQLVPVYADEDGGPDKVSINSQVQQNLGMRTVEVTQGVLPLIPEQDVVVVQARANGYLERLYVASAPLPIRKGQALAQLFVPDWIAAQEDYVAVRRMGAGALKGLQDAALQRMRLAGMSDQQIRLVQSTGQVHSRLTITAPVDGDIIIEPSAREGMAVMPGTPLFRITRVNFTPNTSKEVLLIPSEAVIQTGKRSVVMIALGDGKFSPVNIEIGLETNGQTEVRKGLEAGQKVVISGQFLIDSEASLKGVEARMNAMSNGSGTNKLASSIHRGTGKVEKIDKDEITLSHGPIPSLQWGPMTMSFKPPTTGLSKNIAVGDSVAFEIHQMPDGQFQITTISPAVGQKGAVK